MNLNLGLHHFVVAPVVFLFVFVPAGVVSPLVLVIIVALSPIFGIFCTRLNWEDNIHNRLSQYLKVALPKNMPKT